MDVSMRRKMCWNLATTRSYHEEVVAKASDIIGSASRTSHVGGMQRRFVLSTVGSIARLFTSVLSRTTVHNMKTLLDLVQSRPRDTPLVTISNHMSTLDDPLMWGIKGLPMTDPKLCRWTLTAEDICFTNPIFSYIFRLADTIGPVHTSSLLESKSKEAALLSELPLRQALSLAPSSHGAGSVVERLRHAILNEFIAAFKVGKCLPVRRGAGIYQPYMDDALDVINNGDWLHTFPEGKLSQEEGPLRRLKWGTASLIARASVQPIVLPIAHSGFEKVLPENYMFGRRPILPLPFRRITIVVGEPMVFDLNKLKRIAKTKIAEAAHKTGPTDISGHVFGRSMDTRYHLNSSSRLVGTLSNEGLRVESSAALEENALRWMYSHMSENLRRLLQELVLKAKQLNNTNV